MTRGELAAALALILALGWTYRDVSQVGKAGNVSPPIPMAATPAGPPKAPPEDAFADIVRRSLFTPSRRADFSSVSNRPNAVGGQVLRGVLMGAAGSVALFEPLNGGPGQRLRIGSMIGGYRIVAVEEASVTLERDGTRRELAIDESAPSSTIPAPDPGTANFQSPDSNPDFSQARSRAPTLDEIEQ